MLDRIVEQALELDRMRRHNENTQRELMDKLEHAERQLAEAVRQRDEARKESVSLKEQYEIIGLRIVAQKDEMGTTITTLRECNEQLVASEQSIRNEANRLRARVKELEVAAGGLVKRMREIFDHPHYQGVWHCYANHGGDYTNGPKWVNEFDALAKLIDDTPKAVT